MKPSDFEQMDWRLDLCKPEINILEEYDELNQRFRKFALDSIKVFKEITNDQLVRFIVYAYHKNSPFVRKITEPKARKQQALVELGISIDLPEAKAIIDCESKQVAEMIYSFLIGENSPKFSALVMQMDAFYRMNFNLAYGTGVPNKAAIEAIKSLSDNIDSLTHEVFRGEKELGNFVQGSFILNPEQFAHKNHADKPEV